jgi:hypothetical protein
MKFLKRLFIFGLLVTLVAMGVFYFYRNTLVKAGIEEGGSYALGVPVTLDSAKMNFGSKNMSISGLVIDNPPNYKQPSFLEIEHGSITVESGSLRNKELTVSTIALDGIGLTIEKQEGQANYDAILENVNRFVLEEPAADAEPPITVKVNEIVMTDITVSATLLPIGGELSRTSLTLDEVVIDDFDSNKELTIGELTSIITNALLKNVFKAGTGILPDELLTGLGNSLKGAASQLGDLGGAGLETLTDSTDKVLEEGKEIGGKLKDAGKKLFNRN